MKTNLPALATRRHQLQHAAELLDFIAAKRQEADAALARLRGLLA